MKRGPSFGNEYVFSVSTFHYRRNFTTLLRDSSSTRALSLQWNSSVSSAFVVVSPFARRGSHSDEIKEEQSSHVKITMMPDATHRDLPYRREIPHSKKIDTNVTQRCNNNVIVVINYLFFFQETCYIR